MKVLMLILPLILLLAIGCSPKTNYNSSDNLGGEYGPFSTDMNRVSRYIYRHENSEVICYSYSNSLQCKFKEKK